MRMLLVMIFALVALAGCEGGVSGPPPPTPTPAPPSFAVALKFENEVPPTLTSGQGTATITIDTIKAQVCFDITVSAIKLPAKAAQLQHGIAGSNGPKVLDFTAPDASGAAKGCLAADAALMTDIIATPYNYYVNIITDDAPDGAVRGQLG